MAKLVPSVAEAIATTQKLAFGVRALAQADGDESPTTNQCARTAMNRLLRTNAREFLRANTPRGGVYSQNDIQGLARLIGESDANLTNPLFRVNI